MTSVGKVARFCIPHKGWMDVRSLAPRDREYTGSPYMFPGKFLSPPDALGAASHRDAIDVLYAGPSS